MEVHKQQQGVPVVFRCGHGRRVRDAAALHEGEGQRHPHHGVLSWRNPHEDAENAHPAAHHLQPHHRWDKPGMPSFRRLSDYLDSVRTKVCRTSVSSQMFVALLTANKAHAAGVSFRPSRSGRPLQWPDGKQSHGVLHVHHHHRRHPWSHPGVGNPSRKPETERKKHNRFSSQNPRGQQPGRLPGPDQKPVPREPGPSLLPTGGKTLLLEPLIL